MEQEITEDKIRDYLKSRMPEAEAICVSGLEKVVGGFSRETLSFEAQWIEEGRRITRSFIIRRDPIASLLESEREPEFRVMQSLGTTPVPVPKMYWLELNEKWLGRPFSIMEKMPGSRSAFHLHIFAPEDPALRARIAGQWVEILADIHTVDWRGLGLSFLGVPGSGIDCARREVDKWEKVINKDKFEPQPILTEGLLWLKSNLPEAEQITLVHGDFKQDNFLFEGERITAFLDWEMAHLGDPMEDLGWACMGLWRQDTALMCGLLPREEFYRLYEELSGIKVDAKKVIFYEVLATVKMAAIVITGVRSFSEAKSHNITLGLLGFISMPRLESDLADLLGF